MTVSVTQDRLYVEPGLHPPVDVGDGVSRWELRSEKLLLELIQVDEGAELAVGRESGETVLIVAEGSPAVELTTPSGSQTIDRTALVALTGVTGTVTSRGSGFVYLLMPHATIDAGGPAVEVFYPDDYEPHGRKRVFAGQTWMINIGVPRDEPKPTDKMTPHTHATEEQCSLITVGRYVHHLRYPWTPDMSEWKEDEHLEVGSPSATLIPPGTVHTSQNVGEAPWRLIDIFAPPRSDFAEAGYVLNERKP